MHCTVQSGAIKLKIILSDYSLEIVLMIDNRDVNLLCSVSSQVQALNFVLEGAQQLRVVKATSMRKIKIFELWKGRQGNCCWCYGLFRDLHIGPLKRLTLLSLFIGSEAFLKLSQLHLSFVITDFYGLGNSDSTWDCWRTFFIGIIIKVIFAHASKKLIKAPTQKMTEKKKKLILLCKFLLAVQSVTWIHVTICNEVNKTFQCSVMFLQFQHQGDVDL